MSFKEENSALQRGMLSAKERPFQNAKKETIMIQGETPSQTNKPVLKSDMFKETSCFNDHLWIKDGDRTLKV